MYYSEYFFVLLNDYINIKSLNYIINHLQVTYTTFNEFENTSVTKEPVN